ncbi:murein hydrolase activator EnvC family protein [Denitromonas halophila]|uniref:murein hydrolase activator EnvC family protein n=1 Tax=Denitromonas halophila TaxID=1629404 RepID=UPI00164329D3|nr:peptidoglycan DD-metalloendopeptidase family protein [Denitromonas halophila]
MTLFAATCGRPSAALALMLALAVFPAWVAAEDASGRIASSRSDLDAIKARLRSAQAEVADTETTHAEAAKALKQADVAVSRILRRVRELVRERKRADAAVLKVEAALRETEAQVVTGRAALASWLRRYYQHGGEPGVAYLLSAREPNQLARDAFYLEQIGREKQAIVTRLREAMALQHQQQTEAEARRAEVVRLEAVQRREMADLKKERARRGQIVATLSKELKAQKQVVADLQRDEARLRALMVELEKARARPRPPPPVAIPSSPGEPVVGASRESADSSTRGKAFSALRGQLKPPLRGAIIGRFGADRASGGTTWKGVFIRANSGEEVHAVADGEVVFSDWLRGFGNLIIIDHGQGYLTVYGNNDALFKSNGVRVSAGEVLAAAGDSGGNPEPGLYFEIRHQGRPVDPMEWIRLN